MTERERQRGLQAVTAYLHGFFPGWRTDPFEVSGFDIYGLVISNPKMREKYAVQVDYDFVEDNRPEQISELLRSWGLADAMRNAKSGVVYIDADGIHGARKSRQVPAHEANQALEVVKELLTKETSKEPKLRAIVKGIRVDFGEDSEGKPALWVYYFIDDKTKPSSEEVALLNDLANVTTTGLLDQDITAWPYVTFTARRSTESRGPSSRPA